MMVDVMAKPLTADETQRIAELCREGRSRNEIARLTGKSTSTITRVAKSIDHDFLAACDAATQSSLTRAHASRSAFSAERRASSAAEAQAKADEVLAAFWDPEEFVVAGGDRAGDIVECRPSKRSLESAAGAYEKLVRSILAISKHDVKPDEGQHKGMFGDFSEQLRVARGR